MEEIAFTIVPKAYEEWDFYTDSSTSTSSSSGQTKGVLSEPRDLLPPREATAKDAQKHGILAGYSLKHWNPEEEPIVLLGSVFDAKSLGKWIYDSTVFYHGADTHKVALASHLRVALFRLAERMKRINVNLSHSRNVEVATRVEHLVEQSWIKFKHTMKVCEEHMLKRSEEVGTVKMGEENEREFVEALFGGDRYYLDFAYLISDTTLSIKKFDHMLRGAAPPAREPKQEVTPCFQPSAY